MSFLARYVGICRACDDTISVGDDVRYNLRAEIVHVACPDPTSSAQPGETVCPVCWLIHPEGECDR